MPGVLCGYARVSTNDQDLTVQLTALREAGCEKIFEEKVSGKTREKRPELASCLAFLREGDTLVITRLDRLGRSVLDLISIVENLAKRGIRFRCLQQPVTVDDASSRMFFRMLAVFAEFELDIRRERQAEGNARAKAEGKTWGGSKPIYDATKTIEACRVLVAKHGWGATECAKHLRMSTRTLYRKVAKADPPLFGAQPEHLRAEVEKFDVRAR